MQTYQNYPCDKTDCLKYKMWTPEMPYVISQGKGDYVYQLNVLLICYACIHFRAEDNYITQEDLDKDK